MMHDIRFETWPPNCTQFRHLCLSTREPAAPSVMVAFREVCHNRYCSVPSWSHPAIKLTIKCLGAAVVYAEDEKKAFDAFSKKYAQICERMVTGHPLPVVHDNEVRAPEFKRDPASKMSQNIKELLAFLKSPTN